MLHSHRILTRFYQHVKTIAANCQTKLDKIIAGRKIKIVVRLL